MAVNNYIALITIVGITLIAISISQYPTRSESKATLYSQKNCKGMSLTLHAGYGTIHGKTLSDLAIQKFDNKARSMRSTGLWLLYEDVNFKGEMEFQFNPERHCSNFDDVGGKVSSVRAGGDSNGWDADAVHLFKGDWFRGTAELVDKDRHLLTLVTMNSLIVTGKGKWTLFEFPNFSGKSWCIGTGDLNPSFYCNIGDASKGQGQVQGLVSIGSFKKGCDENVPYLEAVCD